MESNSKRPKKGTNYNEEKELTKLSKTMSYLLRHEAHKHNLYIESNGFVNLDELIKSNPMKSVHATKELILKVVETDKKGRYELIDRPPMFIRAVQGHSITTIKNEDVLEPITNIFEFPVIVHGTYYEAWELIKKSGLNKMSRHAIHFSIGHMKDENVKSGMRTSCQVFIEINPITAFYDGIQFFISKNRVILVPGINGILPAKYIKLATDHKQNLLYGQKFEVHVYIRFGQDVIDYTIIEDGKIYKTGTLNNINGDTLSTLPEFLINDGLVKKPFAIVIDKTAEKEYINLITNNLKDIKYPAFYSDYIIIDPITKQGEIEKEISAMSDKFNAGNMRRVNMNIIEEKSTPTIQINQNKKEDFRLNKDVLYK